MQETLVRSKGYPLETHEVATQDGYLLQMHRILHGRDGHCGANETGMACCERGPVFVMTGLLADSASLVLDFPKQSLGYVLADNGYDVWLGNVRGTTYGKKHKELEVKSKKFWNFSFHEHAIFDVPANIDYILRETKRKDLLYIGMSQGTLTFFTMLAEKPWYNDKIKAFIGLAPFYKLGHLKVPPLAVFSPHAEAPLRQAYAAGSYEVLPQGMPIAGFVRHFCGHATRGICSYLADNFANFGSRYINESRLPVYLCHLPAGTSMKNVIHFDQLVKSKKFQKFDYGPFYNKNYYGKVSPPIFLAPAQEHTMFETKLEVRSSCGRKIKFFGPGIGIARLLGSGRHDHRQNGMKFSDDFRKQARAAEGRRGSGIGGPVDVAPGDTSFASSRLCNKDEQQKADDHMGSVDLST
nr:lysosomal acid lipase/cholesteryl ester hydrolase-like [Rhipicephalus microplus]